jgi:ClpP class serine protease
MTFSIIFLILFIIAAVQPVIRQRMLETARQRLLREFEQARGSRGIVLIHRQETLALLGFPLARYLSIQDSEQVLRAIKLTDPDVPIDLLLHTPGGMVLAAEQIAYALCKHRGRVTVFVPHYAMSGGTMIALAADEVVMDDNAVLGPIDPQIGQCPAASILRVVEQKEINEIDDQTLIMADVARKAIDQVQSTVRRILAQRGEISEDRAEDLAQSLSSGRWTHDYPITVEEARELGLPVATEMPEQVYKLMSLYPQTMQRRPSVEYIPQPYLSRPTVPPDRARER